jgi:hypothetical protein
VTGPGAALWVEVTEVDTPAATERVRTLAGEYRGVVISILQQRGAWQLIDSVQSITDPSLLADSAGYAPYLSLAQKVELLETVHHVEPGRRPVHHRLTQATTQPHPGQNSPGHPQPHQPNSAFTLGQFPLEPQGAVALRPSNLGTAGRTPAPVLQRGVASQEVG